MADSVQPAALSAVAPARQSALRRVIPLACRRYDLLFVIFFLVNLCFVTYIVDIEQIIIPDPAHFQYPLWPPAPFVDAIHWWGRSFDPLLLARPPWWKATIWIDQLFFGPFYAFAIYAFLKGKDWIRLPGVIWASVMMTNVTIILSEEAYGPNATPHFAMVFLANLSWLLFPIALIARMARSEHPFTEPAPGA